MKATGKLKSISRDWQTNKPVISFELDYTPEDLQEMSDADVLDITAKKHRNRRSVNANALLWKCLEDIAAAIDSDKWSIYLQMLKKYGEFTYIVVKPQAVPMLKNQWRECEELGEIDIHGTTGIQMLCYYGSSTYDTKQFSRLLNGVMSEMKEIGIETPTEEQMRKSLERWESYGKTKAD